MVREAFKQKDKHIHLLGVNGESLKVTFGKNAQVNLM